MRVHPSFIFSPSRNTDTQNETGTNLVDNVRNLSTLESLVPNSPLP